MKVEATGGAAGSIGRWLGWALKDHLSSPAVEAVQAIRVASAPVLRAFVDAFIAEKIVSATWPSVLVLATVVAVHLICIAASSHEVDRVIVGMVVLGAVVWSAVGLCRAVNVSLPFAKVWFVTRLPPVKQARLLIFQWLREIYESMTTKSTANSFKQDVVKSTLLAFQKESGLVPNEIIFLLADNLALILLRHTIKRLLLLVSPIIAAFMYYRLAIYPNVISKFTNVGPWQIALYPMAALSDGLLNTHFRATLE